MKIDRLSWLRVRNDGRATVRGDHHVGDQSIAIVGVACRLPGGIASVDQLWQALSEERDLVGHAPPDRFDEAFFVDAQQSRTGKSYTAAGGFLDDLASFDAAHFGISPKEAEQLDPQQRLLLEMAVEALDDAGIAPESLAGTDTAVYVGISDSSYGGLQMMSPATVNAYTMSGAALSISANRLSYALDLRGPSMAVDTACSSSLVALDRACRTVLEGTSRTALCGGVNVLLSPHHFIGFSQASMLSRRGHCAAFSADADGFVRAEGGGVLVLKRLADAQADGDRVHGVILASGSNSDGRTMGMALPSAQAQADLLRGVYARAGIGADEVAYFEAHGTGTPVGDPIECAAIGQALGRHRSVGPLPIGSVKSNVGHLEPASGVIGVLKALLVLRHRHIPSSLHADSPNPEIDFAALGLTVATRARPVHRDGRVVVGVNSFGFGGANAHVVLASPPAPPRAPVAEEGLRPVVVSASSPQALAEATQRLAAHLTTATDFYDLAYTSCLRRGRHRYRRAVLAADPVEAAELLGAATEVEAVAAGRVCFVFSGNGSQWAGMGVDLLADKDFRAALEQVESALTPWLGWSVLERLQTVTEEDLAATEIAQPLLFAVQVAMVETLRGNGVHASAVVGHSVGEVAAAWAAGALTLEQAAWVIAERSRAQASTVGSGRMAAIALSAAEVAQLSQDLPAVTIAGVNTATDVTVAGPTGQVATLLARCAQRELLCTELDLDYAFHSPAMDPVREPLHAALAELCPSTTAIPLFSTVSGERIQGQELGGDYWWRNVREPVQFADAIARALEDGADILVEIGPHPVLSGYLRRITATRPQIPTAVIPTLHRDIPGPHAMRAAVATVLAAGDNAEWRRYFPHPGRVTDLPAYPWQRELHWSGTPERWIRTSGTGRIEHPLLGERIPAPTPLWHCPVDPVLVPWLVDHRLMGAVVMPAAAYVEMALSAGARTLGGPVEVCRMDISRPLVVPWPDTAGLRTQLAVDPVDGTVRISGSGDTDAEPGLYVRCRVRALVGTAPSALDVSHLQAGLSQEITGAAHYEHVDRLGLNYGPTFQVLTTLWAGQDRVVASYQHTCPDDGFILHPVVLDAALQAVVPLAAERLRDQALLPCGMDTLRVWRQPEKAGFVHVRARRHTATEMCWDITITNPDGTVTVDIEGARMRVMAAHVSSIELRRYHTELRAAPHPEEPCAPVELPATSELLASADERITTLRERHLSTQRRASELPLELAAHRIVEMIRHKLPGMPEFDLNDLVAAGMLPRYRRFLALFLPVAHACGLLSPAGSGRWRLAGSAPDGDAAVRATCRELPAHNPELLLSLSVWQNLTQVLFGELDPVEMMAGEENERLLAQFFDSAPANRFHHLVVQALLRQVLAHWPADRPLRILEVGGGTGALAATLLPMLPADRTRYVFTDVSPYFFTRAEQRFADYDFIEYRTYDLDCDPAEQGFTAGGFDLVLAANALHTARDLTAALRSLADVLAPGGRLLAYESHNPRLLGVFFGLLDSFWVPEDQDLRPETLLLPFQQWPGVLRQAGFSDVGQVQAGPDFSVLLATAPTTRALPTRALPTGEATTRWTLLVETSEERPLAEHTARLLHEAGCPPPRVCAMQRWASSTGEAVVLVLGVTEEPQARAVRVAGALRALAATSDAGELWLVTRPCGALPTDVEAPADAAVWGLVRVLDNEAPNLTIRRISLSRNGDPATRLARELLSPSAENEIALTANGRFVPRETVLPAIVADPPAYQLAARSPGLSYELIWQAIPRPEPGPGQVRVAVRAAALNYRDIMQVTGILPAELHEQVGECAPGLECAGVITAVGDAVEGFAVGDRVAGLALGAFASEVVTSVRSLIPLPQTLSFGEAATMPVVFATVIYSLDHLARLQAEETVLVHGGAGGIGLATLQYAHAHGARVIATAGSPVKRALLRALGVEHVLDSRSLDFAAEVMAITGGRGVDVVLNSLAGPAIARGLELLRPGGRFIELGKRDMVEDNDIPLRPFLNNIAFFGVDLASLSADPDHAALLATNLDKLAGYRPLPHVSYPAGRVAEAFRQLQHSWHVGKIVVTFDPDSEPVVVTGKTSPPACDPNGTYLITGGLSGFGAATARWLADRGARNLALVSRRGAEAPEAPALLEELAARGVHAIAHAADSADAEAMRQIVTDLNPPLRGVVHAAMHLDDAPLTELTDQQLAAVLRPKLGGALVLDDLTRDRDLDLFLLYSSGTALIGNAQQAPYVAGNLFLEALARHRRQRGLPALALAWGAIADTGYVARSNLAAALVAVGLETTGPEDAFAVMRDLLGRADPVAGVGRYNWPRLTGTTPALRAPRFAPLTVLGGADTGETQEDLLRRLAEISPEEAREFIAAQVTELLAEVLRMDPTDLDRHRRIDTYGVDSLTATELLLSARRTFDVDIPALELARHGGTIASFTELVHQRLGLRRPERTPA